MKPIDLSGKKFEMLTVVGRYGSSDARRATWRCLCECGRERIVVGKLLRSGIAKSCGCCKRSDYLVGARFGKLVVVERKHGDDIERKNGNSLWQCRCDCGALVARRRSTLRDNINSSCGCVASGSWNKTHGTTNTRIYRIWSHMKERCSAKNTEHRKHYFDRGIIVSERWMSFDLFHLDMGDPPSRWHQIDRIDYNGNYCPENCRWVTAKEQQRNKRSNLMLTYNGKTQCASAWSEELGIPYTRIQDRISYGWSDERALTTPKLR